MWHTTDGDQTPLRLPLGNEAAIGTPMRIITRLDQAGIKQEYGVTENPDESKATLVAFALKKYAASRVYSYLSW